MIERKRILVTGSAGRLGRAAVRELKAHGHFVRGFDLCASPRVDESIVATLTDFDAIQHAASGVDALVHLAATPDDDDFLTRIVPNNIIGVHNVLEAARLARVKRVVLASSGQVVWWQRFTGPIPITVDVQPTPRGWYAAAKLFAEGAGRAYVEAHGMSVMAVRLGWCPRDKAHVAELGGTTWGPDVYLSPGDAGRFFACAVETDAPFTFAVVYVCSKPLNTLVYDPEPARRFGYEACDAWPQGSLDDLPT